MCELLESGEPTFFEGTTLVCPPLMFSVMLYVEHALGDFLHGKLLLKHVVDWAALRRQEVDWETFWTKCKEFRFDRFVALIEAEGNREGAGGDETITKDIAERNLRRCLRSGGRK